MRPLLLLLYLALLSFLSSFSQVPVETLPPLNKKEKRLQKRLHHLKKRFETAPHSRQQRRLQKRIRHLERQQIEPKLPFLTVLAFILALIGIVPLVVLLVKMISTGQTLPPYAVDPHVFWGVPFFFFIGHALLIAIFALLFYHKKPALYKGKGLALAALAIAIGAILALVITIVS